MRIPWRRLAWLAAAAIPIAVIGGVIWGATRDLSSYQARLTELVRKSTGRELAARVPLTVKLGSEPAMVAEGVTLSNAAWGSRPELARVRRLTLMLDPVALLLGEVKIGKLILEGADILVERNDLGEANLEMLPPPDGSGPHARESRSFRLRTAAGFPWIDNIEVRDSVLTIREAQNRPPVVIDVPTASFRANAANQSLQMEGRFSMPQAMPMQLTGAIGSFDGWMRGLPGNIDVQGDFGNGKIAVKGSVGIKGTALQITSEGADVSAIGPYVQLPVPSGGPYALNAKASTQRSGFKVEMTTLKVGSSEMTGEALFRTDRKGVPTILVNADITRLDVSELRAPPAIAAAAPATAPVQPRLIPTMPFQASWLGRSSLSATVRLGEVVGLGAKMQNASVTLVSGETRFAFRAAGSVGQGTAGLDLVYDPAGRLGSSTLTASANRVSLGELSTLLGLDIGLREGVADIDLRLRGTGRTTRDAANSANGTIDIAIGKGLWPKQDLAGWPAETQRLLGGTEAGIPFGCIAGRFDVSGGVANLRRLVVDTPRAVLVGGGYVSLRTDGWEFILAPEARDNGNAALASPLRLRGGGGRPFYSGLEPNLAKLLVGTGPIPSLVAQATQAGRQPNANACAALAPRVEALRPGLRAQLPAPVDPRQRPNRPAGQTPGAQRSRQ